MAEQLSSVWFGRQAPSLLAAGERGSVQAGLSRGSLMALGHAASTGSGEAAPNLSATRREEHLLGSAELHLVTPCLLASVGDSPRYGRADHYNSSPERRFPVSFTSAFPRPSGAVPGV